MRKNIIILFLVIIPVVILLFSSQTKNSQSSCLVDLNDYVSYRAIMYLNDLGQDKVFIEDQDGDIHLKVCDDTNKELISVIQYDNNKNKKSINWKYTKDLKGSSVIWGLINDNEINEVHINLGNEFVNGKITSINGKRIFYYPFSNKDVQLPIKIIGKSDSKTINESNSPG
ncbi:hypothetical protein [Brevibacillus fortis]|uniref:hypothetical protein n=1 Tax=Brevibacillus fortis TaxID=2126352 RepID=UPI0038FC5F99